jgi:transposase-like protein
MSRPGGRQPRFTPEDVERMHALRAGGMSAVKIARELRTSHSVVMRYLRGDCRHHDPNWRWPTMRKLTDEQVAAIRARVSNGESLRSVARDYDVAFTTVRNAVRREYRQAMRAVA